MPLNRAVEKFIIKRFLLIAVPAFFSISGGCGFPTVSGIVEGLNHQNDLELVCDGSSSYLLLLDSLLANDSTDTKLLINSTKAYSAYVNVMTECGRPGRSAILSEKAKKYGLRLLKESAGIKNSDSLELLSTKLQKSDRSDVEALFWGAYGWAIWTGYQRGAPAAVIDLPKIEMIMERIVELDERFYNGGAHLFLGIYHSLKPVVYGGDLEASRSHFEKAMEISNHEFLPVHVAYAEHYAKMTLDRKLYTSLLEEVLAFDISTVPALTLSNTVAKKQAVKLLEEAGDYF